MIRKIRKNLVILQNRSPFAPQVTAYLESVEQLDWLYQNLKLDGSPLSREQIHGILNGDCVSDARVSDHVLISRLDEARKRLYACAGAGMPIGPDLILGLAGLLAENGRESGLLRKTTPHLIEYAYTPPLPSELPEKLDAYVAFANRKQDFEDPFDKAAQLHFRMIELYPFREHNGFLARSLMEYHLLREGFPLAVFDMDESTYNRAVIAWLKKRESAALTEALKKACLARTEFMMRLTAYEN